MPGKDSTGPLGQGPGTGRGMGPCGAGMRRGNSRGLGRSFGQGMGYCIPMTKSEETETLENEADILAHDLKAVKERLSDLEGKK